MKRGFMFLLAVSAAAGGRAEDGGTSTVTRAAGRYVLHVVERRYVPVRLHHPDQLPPAVDADRDLREAQDALRDAVERAGGNAAPAARLPRPAAPRWPRARRSSDGDEESEDTDGLLDDDPRARRSARLAGEWGDPEGRPGLGGSRGWLARAVDRRQQRRRRNEDDLFTDDETSGPAPAGSVFSVPGGQTVVRERVLRPRSSSSWSPGPAGRAGSWSAGGDSPARRAWPAAGGNRQAGEYGERRLPGAGSRRR